ncbi:MAG: NADH-quinone oxidoreductase subunit C [Vicinamibacterales bacterium]
MDPTAIVALLQEAVPAASLETVPGIDLQATVYVSRDHLGAVARTLRTHPDLQFALLAEVAAVDLWPYEPRFELHYILVSIQKGLRLRLKVRVSGADAHVTTVSDIWPAANWLEREVWDLFGIVFDGHPDPRRLLMPEDWEGFPLRKDYPVQIQMKPRTTEPMQVTEEEFRANMIKDRLSRS